MFKHSNFKTKISNIGINLSKEMKDLKRDLEDNLKPVKTNIENQLGHKGTINTYWSLTLDAEAVTAKEITSELRLIGEVLFDDLSDSFFYIETTTGDMLLNMVFGAESVEPMTIRNLKEVETIFIEAFENRP